MAAPDPASFRTALAGLPTGVTIVSASGPEGPAGATANAVCSLSIEPMMMLACLDRGSRTLLAVQAADRFGISVLHAGQEPIARAFANQPKILLADEPTGNLDSRNGSHIFDLMTRLHDDNQTTLVLVTHDHELAKRAHRQIRLRDGRVVADEVNKQDGQDEQD